MNGYEAYKEYLALKQHFTKPTYDYIKYNGKVRSNQDSFNKRKDKVFFDKLAKHENVHNFLIANLVKDPKVWVKELAYSENAEQIYLEWKKRQQSLSYHFKTELGKLDEEFNSNFKPTKNESHPFLFRLYLAEVISLETLCILLKVTKSKKYWDDIMEYDPIYETIKLTIEKYTPLIKFDEDKYKKIVLEFFTNL
jgi:hypothetical protein